MTKAKERRKELLFQRRLQAASSANWSRVGCCELACRSFSLSTSPVHVVWRRLREKVLNFPLVNALQLAQLRLKKARQVYEQPLLLLLLLLFSPSQLVCACVYVYVCVCVCLCMSVCVCLVPHQCANRKSSSRKSLIQITNEEEKKRHTLLLRSPDNADVCVGSPMTNARRAPKDR